MASYETQLGRQQVRFFGHSTEKIAIRLDQYVLKVLPEDLLTVLRGVAAQELNAQIDIGNNPSQVLVDGRAVGTRSIYEAKRAVSMRFADTTMLLTAISEAYELLRKVTRLQSPPKNNVVARDNFHLYLNGNPLGLLPSALSRLTPGSLDTKSVLRVVGPLVPYGRKLFWRPIGRSSGTMAFNAKVTRTGRAIHTYGSDLDPQFRPLRMRTLRRLANAAAGDKAANLRNLVARNPGSVEGTNQIVRRVLTRDRRFKALHISDGWISYPPAKSWGKNSRDDRVPSISIQMARRGAVRVINLL